MTHGALQAVLERFAAAALIEDAGGDVAMVSEHFFAMFGVDAPEQVVGRNAREFLDVIAGQVFLDPDGFMEGVDAIMSSAIEVRDEPVTTVTNRRIVRDVLRLSVEGADAGRVWLFRETEVSSAAQEQDSATRAVGERQALQAVSADVILDSMPLQFAVFSPTGTYVYVSPSAVEDPETRRWMMGRTDVEYGLRRGLPEVVVERRRRHLWTAIQSGEATDFEEAIETRTGEILYFRRYNVPVVDEAGSVRLVLGYGLDITKERRSARELQRTQKSEVLGRFVGGIAHDFNNAIMVISGFATLLRDSVVDEQSLRLVDRLVQASLHARDLTQRLLAFGRPESEDHSIVDVNEVVAETVEMLQRVLGEGISVHQRLTPDAPAARCGVVQLQQVLLNLGVNARDAMEGSGVLTITTSLRRISEPIAVNARRLIPGVYVELKVSDTGPGMTPEVLERALQPFFTTKANDQGTGLGLAVVDSIAGDLDGAVEAKNEEGGGLSVSVLIPAREAAKRIPVAVENARPAAQPGHRPGRVLVVEDEPELRGLVRQVLVAAGHEVLEAGDGREGLQLARENIDGLDVVLSDVGLPNLGGRELTAALKSERPSLPVVLMSGFLDIGDSNDPVLGHDAFLEKPFSVRTLTDVVHRFLPGSPDTPAS